MLAVDRLHQPGQLLESTAAFDCRTRIDQYQFGIRCDGMNHLQIHGGLTAALLGHGAHDLHGDGRDLEQRGEAIHVGLVETVEGEHHHGRALTGETLVGQRPRVVGAQQLGGLQTAVGHIARRGRRKGDAVGQVAEDAAQPGNLGARGGRDVRLLRRGVEDPACLRSETGAVVVDGDAESLRHRRRGSLDDGPIVTVAPPQRQTVGARPAVELHGTRRCPQGGGELNPSATRRPEIVGGVEQRGVRTVDDAGVRPP